MIHSRIDLNTLRTEWRGGTSRRAAPVINGPSLQDRNRIWATTTGQEVMDFTVSPVLTCF